MSAAVGTSLVANGSADPRRVGEDHNPYWVRAPIRTDIAAPTLRVGEDRNPAQVGQLLRNDDEQHRPRGLLRIATTPTTTAARRARSQHRPLQGRRRHELQQH
jgi:hypothetical protein